MEIRKYIILIIFFGFTHLNVTASNRNLDSLIRVAEKSSDTALINTLVQIADLQKLSNPDTALYYINKANKLAAQSNNKTVLANVLFEQGNILYFNNFYADAKKSFNKSLALSKKLNDPLLEAWCLERLASLNLATGNSNLSLSLYYKSLSLFEKTDNLKGKAKIYNILGIYKADTKKYDTAENYLLKSLEIHRKLNDTFNIIENIGNLGYLYQEMGKLNKAEKTYKELIPVIIKSNDAEALPVIYYNLSSIYQSKGEMEKAKAYLQNAIQLSEKRNDSALLTNLYGNMGELLLYSHSLDSSKILLNKSILFSNAIGDIEAEIHALSLLSKIDSSENNMISALKILQRISSLKDTLYDMKLANRLKESELEYKNRKSTAIISMQKDIIRASQKSKMLFVLLFIVAIISVILLIRLLYMQKRVLTKKKKIHAQEIKLKELELEKVLNKKMLQKQQQEKIEEELILKERELVTIAMQMDKSTMEMEFIRNKIKELIEKDNVSTADLIKLNDAILQKLKDFNNWDLFYKTFNNVHTDFFKKLKEKHPELTKSELKHCAYIRIHLSSNQISSLLNVTIGAVRKTRYRMRKKLKLKPNESLEDYLIKL